MELLGDGCGGRSPGEDGAKDKEAEGSHFRSLQVRPRVGQNTFLTRFHPWERALGHRFAVECTLNSIRVSQQILLLFRNSTREGSRGGWVRCKLHPLTPIPIHLDSFGIREKTADRPPRTRGLLYDGDRRRYYCVTEDNIMQNKGCFRAHHIVHIVTANFDGLV